MTITENGQKVALMMKKGGEKRLYTKNSVLSYFEPDTPQNDSLGDSVFPFEVVNVLLPCTITENGAKSCVSEEKVWTAIMLLHGARYAQTCKEDWAKLPQTKDIKEGVKSLYPANSKKEKTGGYHLWINPQTEQKLFILFSRTFPPLPYFVR